MISNVVIFVFVATCVTGASAFTTLPASTTSHDLTRTFAPSPLAPHCRLSRTSHLFSSEDSSTDGKSLQDIFNNVDLEKYADNSDQIRANIFEGELGERGELYVLVQAILFLSILLGFVPVVGDAIDVVFGPIIFLVGATVAVVSVFDLGKSLSPWPVPISEEKGGDGLITTGLYSQVRHPIYAGAIAAAVGLSIITQSANRLLFTAFLVYLFDIKSEYEEEKLQNVFPSYEAYTEQVPSKFVPKILLDILYPKKL